MNTINSPGGTMRDETARAILLVKHQRAKRGEVQRQGLSIPRKVKMDKLAVDARKPASSKAVALLHFQPQLWGLG